MTYHNPRGQEGNIFRYCPLILPVPIMVIIDLLLQFLGSGNTGNDWVMRIKYTLVPSTLLKKQVACDANVFVCIMLSFC